MSYAHDPTIICVIVEFLDSATIDDLKVACGIKYKPVQDINLNTVPDECTSVLLNSKDFPGIIVTFNFTKKAFSIEASIILI